MWPHTRTAHFRLPAVQAHVRLLGGCATHEGRSHLIVARVIDAQSKLATARALAPETAISTLGGPLDLGCSRAAANVDLEKRPELPANEPRGVPRSKG